MPTFMKSVLFKSIFSIFLSIIISSCGSTASVEAAEESDMDSIDTIESEVANCTELSESNQNEALSVEPAFPTNTLETGSVAFWKSDIGERVFLSCSDFRKLSDNIRKELKPLGLVVKINNKFYILNHKRSNKDTDWYSAMTDASKCHPYDDGRWSLPSLSEARGLAKVQDDIVYWIPRWENEYPRVLFDLNGTEIETFVSDNSSDFIDVTLSNGQIEVNRVKRCDADKAKDYPYTKAYYISEVKHSVEEHYHEGSRPAYTNNNASPVQVWKQCTNCFGSGQCPYCYGQGYISDVYGTRDCPVCTDGRCSICAGHGGHYELEYN